MQVVGFVFHIRYFLWLITSSAAGASLMSLVIRQPRQNVVAYRKFVEKQKQNKNKSDPKSVSLNLNNDHFRLTGSSFLSLNIQKSFLLLLWNVNNLNHEAVHTALRMKCKAVFHTELKLMCVLMADSGSYSERKLSDALSCTDCRQGFYFEGSG